MKDPAFLFYTGDFLAGTMFFTDEQVGIYLRLLLAQHQHGRLSEKQVNFICKSYDNEVLEKFEKDEEGNYYNLRLETEINKRKSYSESRSNNRKGKVKQDKPKRKKTSITYDIHMEDRDKDINKTELDKKIEEFLNFRKEIKKPVSEISLIALKEKLKKLSNGNENDSIEILNNSIANSWQGVFPLDKKTQKKATGALMMSNIDPLLYETYQEYSDACYAENKRPAYEEFYDRLKYESENK